MRFPSLLVLSLIIMAAPYALNAPLDITADELTVTPNTNQAIFSGSVKLTQEGITLSAGTITINSTAENQDIKNIIASQNVTFTFQDGTATGNRAEWQPGANVITLSGNVQLTQSGNTLTGTTLRYDLTQAKATLSAGNTGRVKAVFGAVKE